jgi:hypothetical protein
LGALLLKNKKFLYRCQYGLVWTRRIEFKFETQIKQHLYFIQGFVDVSYAAPQVHEIVNVALRREYSPGTVFIFFQGSTDLYHV